MSGVNGTGSSVVPPTTGFAVLQLSQMPLPLGLVVLSPPSLFPSKDLGWEECYVDPSAHAVECRRLPNKKQALKSLSVAAEWWLLVGEVITCCHSKLITVRERSLNEADCQCDNSQAQKRQLSLRVDWTPVQWSIKESRRQQLSRGSCNEGQRRGPAR